MVINYTKNKKNTIATDLTWQSLHEADFTLSVPFQLTLTDSQEILTCEKIIRLVPRKRMVVFAKWGDLEVVAKLFFNRKEAKQACFRDLRGVKALVQANIPTPKLLYEGTVRYQSKIHVVVLEKIHDANNLADIWRNHHLVSDIVPLMHAVTIEIATHHVLGILQRDLHLKNFLVTAKVLYSLDGSKITQYDRPIVKKMSLYYLALFFVQLGVGTQTLQQELLQVYAKARGWVLKKQDIHYLNRTTQAIRQDLNRRYQKKIFRDCTLFKSINALTQRAMYDREYQSTEFMALLQDPEAIFLQPTTKILKNGRSSTVATIVVNQKTLVIKRYNIKNIWHGLRRCFRATRAVKSWRLGQHIYMAGVPTAKPIAFIEKRFCGWKGKSYLIMEHITGLPAQDYFADFCLAEEKFAKTARAILSLLQNLKELRLTHGDLKASNILVQDGLPVIIDLDGMQEYQTRFFFASTFSKELSRFLRNWDNKPELYAFFTNVISVEHGLSTK